MKGDRSHEKQNETYAEEKVEENTPDKDADDREIIDVIPDAFVNMSDNIEFPNRRFF